MFHFEHRRTKGGDSIGKPADEAVEDPNAGKTIVDWGEDGKPIYDDGTVGELPGADDADQEPTPAGGDEGDTSGMWEESFGSHRDSKPQGASLSRCQAARVPAW